MLDTTRHGNAPFDTALLDRLMDEAGLDVLIATSKHNVQYLLGGHRSFFFDNMDAIGIGRYLPAFVYPKGAPDKAAYFGHGMETYQTQLKPFWVSEVNTKSGGSVDVMQKAADYARGLVKKGSRIGVELAFIPANSEATLRKALPDAEIKDALFVLERLRVRKTPDELEKLRLASELVIELDARGDWQPRRRRDQGGIDGSVAPRGDIARIGVRLLFDCRLLEPQSRALRSALGKRRAAVRGFGRQLSWLYRRSRAHGHCRRARRRAGRLARRNRGHAAGRVQADPSRRQWD